ncbi:MAG TPA: oxidoreductase [Balneolales bacterium]|nr:oxidoreductase [Balneolales bacterium]
MTDPVNVGIVGFGMSAQVFHAPFLDINPDFRICKVVERHDRKSKQKYPYIDVVTDISELLSDPDIHLVVITTPNTTHLPLARAALEAGKHVVLEKPFTITTKDADELIQLADKQKSILSVFQNRRWDGDFLTVKNILESGYLGRLVEFESHYDRFRNYQKPDAWKEENLPGSGILYDLGPHLIDQALVLFGLPESVTADIRYQRDGSQTDDQFEVNLNYPNLKVTLKAGMLVREPLPRLILQGTEGSYVKYGLDPQEAALKKGDTPDQHDWGMEPKALWGKLNTELNGLHFEGQIETLPGCYQNFYENLYKAITENTKPAVSARQARDTMRIIELAFQSDDEQRTVKYVE